MASKQRRNSAAIYENSTRMAINFMRASSLSLAEMTVGRRAGGRPGLDQRADSAPELLIPPAAQQDVRRLSVEPERHTATYLMADPSTDSATATATVDVAAEAYIRRVRERIRKGALRST